MSSIVKQLMVCKEGIGNCVSIRRSYFYGQLQIHYLFTFPLYRANNEKATIKWVIKCAVRVVGTTTSKGEKKENNGTEQQSIILLIKRNLASDGTKITNKQVLF